MKTKTSLLVLASILAANCVSYAGDQSPPTHESKTVLNDDLSVTSANLVFEIKNYSADICTAEIELTPITENSVVIVKAKSIAVVSLYAKVIDAAALFYERSRNLFSTRITKDRLRYIGSVFWRPDIRAT